MKTIKVKCRIYPEFIDNYFRLRVDVKSSIINESFYYFKKYTIIDTFIDYTTRVKKINKEYAYDSLERSLYIVPTYDVISHSYLYDESSFKAEDYTTIMNKLIKTDFIKTEIISFIKKEFDEKQKDRLSRDKQKSLSKPVNIKFTVEV